MKQIRQLLITVFVIFIANYSSNSQTSVDKYWEFVKNNPNYSIENLIHDYPIGIFKSEVTPIQGKIEYLDSVQEKYNLSTYELELLNKYNFVVTERQNYGYCWWALDDIWTKDLPLFITSDLVLDAFHESYDLILQDLEKIKVIPELHHLLNQMHSFLPDIAEKYTGISAMKAKINDIDIYLTVAKDLLKDSIYSPVFPENIIKIKEILDLIELEKPVQFPLFSSTNKKLDFSQFTPRGHYTIDSTLISYFKTMIWLGRTEFYLIPPEEPGTTEPKQTPEDIQRQIIDVMIINDLIKQNNLKGQFESIDQTIEAMVGITDNVQLNHIDELMLEINITDLSEMLDMAKVDIFQNALSTKDYADQRILSQILMSNPFVKEQIKPASAFIFLGQRFLIDSYITANVVYDRILVNDQKIRRMLPSVYDVLFSLGNNPASDFLRNDLNKYQYSKNLSSLRFLIDSYDNSYWENSIYNLWLNAIRKLNTPPDNIRQTLPKLMKTAAWNQKSMNTQLASWSQLRHDNILYGKQSYTGGVSCSYPYVYIEPVPDFFSAMAALGRKSYNLLEPYLKTIDNKYSYEKNQIKKYFLGLDTVCNKLATIALKEINATKLDQNDLDFLGRSYYDFFPCGGIKSGWIGKLYYILPEEETIKRCVVADIHTAPTDEFGNPVGWVKHVGTGPINLGIFIANNWDGKPTAFCGPVMSFYEYTSLNFKRLTDDEWLNNFDNKNPLMCQSTNIVDLYSADTNGNAKNLSPVSLPTSVEDAVQINTSIDFGIFTKPNPFKENIYINFKVPSALSNQQIYLKIFDMNGILVKELFNNVLPSDNYSLLWDGTDMNNKKAANGEYLCRITIGNESRTVKLILEK